MRSIIDICLIERAATPQPASNAPDLSLELQGRDESGLQFRQFGNAKLCLFATPTSFPVLEEDRVTPHPGVMNGIALRSVGSCANPYFAKSFFNVSVHEFRRPEPGRR